MKLILQLLLFIGCANIKAQSISASKFNPFNANSDLPSIYLGKVIGLSSDKYDSINHKKYLEFGLPKLTNSTYQIEIRFFNEGGIGSLGFRHCTILYFDTTFKIKRSVLKLKNNKSFFGNEQVLFNADSIYDKLIENAVFSLNQFDGKRYFKDTAQKLTPYGFNNVPFYTGGFTDGEWYELDFKVGDTYNSIFMDNPKSMLELNPDNQLMRRYNEIRKIFLIGYK